MRGRPPKKDCERKDNQVTVRFSNIEMSLLEEYANKADKKVASYIRRCVFKEILEGMA